MKKDNINNKLRHYVRTEISPRELERAFIKVVYDSFKGILNNQCIQIGSYPRFTAIRPLHDLDILFFLGPWSDTKNDPSIILKALYQRIQNEYINPTVYEIQVSLQTHSVSISFKSLNTEVFAVDVVPAYSYMSISVEK